MGADAAGAWGQAVTRCPKCRSKKTELPHVDPQIHHCLACDHRWSPLRPFAWEFTGEVEDRDGLPHRWMVIA